MATYQKKNNQLNKKAGLGIIDNILNKFSNNAVSNKVVSEEIERINQHLTAIKIHKLSLPITPSTGFISADFTLDFTISNIDKAFVSVQGAIYKTITPSTSQYDAAYVSIVDNTHVHLEGANLNSINIAIIELP